MDDNKKESLLVKTPDNSVHPKNNIFFIKIKKTKIRIKLLNNKSLNKISKLSNITKDKYIKFKTGYEISDTDSDTDSKDGLRGMAKLKERLSKSDHNNHIYSRYRLTKKFQNYNYNNKYYSNNKKKDKNSFLLFNEVKSSVNTILNKEGNSIGTNYELYKMTWKDLYKWLILFPFIIFIGLFFFICKDNYGFTFAEMNCYLIIFLTCIVSMNGNEKMIAKKNINYMSENFLLYLISFLCLYILICANTDMIENTAYNFLSEYYILVHTVFFTLIVFCFVIIYLNKKMVEFYLKYSQIVESGVLLTDRS